MFFLQLIAIVVGYIAIVERGEQQSIKHFLFSEFLSFVVSTRGFLSGEHAFGLSIRLKLESSPKLFNIAIIDGLPVLQILHELVLSLVLFERVNSLGDVAVKPLKETQSLLELKLIL